MSAKHKAKMSHCDCSPNLAGTRSRFAFSKCLLFVAACGTALTTTGGCTWWRNLTGQTAADEPVATTRAATTQYTQSDVAPVPPGLSAGNRAVVQGSLPGTTPLIYLVESAGTLRVRNVGADEEIIRFDARPGQIVRVDTTGVYLANKPVIGADLSPGTYSIEVVPAGEGIRSTQERTVPQGP